MDTETLANILLELRSESIKARSNPTEGNIKALLHKYDMLFLGENFNSIYSHELTHAIKNTFEITTTLDEVNFLLPTVCKALSMKCEPMIEAKDRTLPDPPIRGYNIIL